MTENKKTDSQPPLKYKMVTAEIVLTDGLVDTVTFYDIDKCFDNLLRMIKQHYVNSIRIELF